MKSDEKKAQSIAAETNKNSKCETKTVFDDLGSGTGKVPLEAFLEFTALTKCVGIEITDERFALAEQNMLKIIKSGYNGRCFELVKHEEGKVITMKEKFKMKDGNIIERICIIWCGSIFDFPGGIKDADMCLIAVSFPCGVRNKVIKLIEQTKKRCTISSYISTFGWPWV